MNKQVLKTTENIKQKNKVLMILHLPPPVHGAGMVGKYIKDSSRINNDFDIDYINLSTSATLNEIGKGFAKKTLRMLQLQGSVAKALLSKKYNLCYITLNSTGGGFIKDLMIVSVLKMFRQNIIYHFHNKGISTRKKNWIENILYKYAFNNTKSILLSPNLYSDFKQYLDQEDVYYCANGIPVSEEPKIKKDYKRNNGEKCRLLFVSNLIIEKGVMALLEACKLLKERQYNFECHFVGAWVDITQADFDEFINRNNLSGYVFVHGPKYNQDKYPFFENSDIFVFPSFKDCFPLVLLEAMSFGLPIVATSEGGIPDIVVDGETGFIVEPRNSYDLAAKLEVLISDPGMCQQFGEAARKRFQEYFTVEQFEENFIKVLDENVVN